MNRGIIFALSAYVFWGVHPVYWKLLQRVPSGEIVAHRIVWSFIFFIVIVALRKEGEGLIKKIRTNRNKALFFIPAFLIGSNWVVYIWAVNAGYIIEASLGYFISPLISVLLGVVFLKERLRILHWLAVLVAGVGVIVMTFFYGHFPWISLYLAGTWATYGLFRKKSPLNPVEGLTLETAVLSIPAVTYLLYLVMAGTGSFVIDPSASLLLIGGGIISGLPLIIFIAGARLIPLSLIGILQYIYPTLIFIIGYFVYHEPLTEGKILGFVFIWIAIVLYYTVDRLFYKRRRVDTAVG
jgi:chloramphenicol-sensitive protein RarD